MQKKPWQVIAYMERLGGGPGSREYFIVQAPDPEAAVRVLQMFRADLADAHIEVRGEARPGMLDWLGVNADVYSIAVVEP
jgi:hypothetical protein